MRAANCGELTTWSGAGPHPQLFSRGEKGANANHQRAKAPASRGPCARGRGTAYRQLRILKIPSRFEICSGSFNSFSR